MTKEQLKSTRLAMRLTQAEFAGLLGLRANSVAMMERGERPIMRVTELAITTLQANTCWLYPLTPGAPRQYPKHNNQYIHRLIHQRLHGPIPEGYVIDHVCRNVRCINPDHHELVTIAENARRSAVTRKQDSDKAWARWNQGRRTANAKK